jgi:hypothetical protein
MMRTKTVANRLGMYDDIRPILDAALSSGGGRLELASRGMAIHWRQRAYKFRKLYAQILASDDSFSMSPYDRLTMPTPPDEGEPDDNVVIINVREATGTFTPNREPYVPVDIPVVGDELLDVAKEIAKKIKEGGL